MTYNSNRTTGAARTHIRKNTLAGAVSAAVVAWRLLPCLANSSTK
jgi:hypothetical protein